MATLVGKSGMQKRVLIWLTKRKKKEERRKNIRHNGHLMLGDFHASRGVGTSATRERTLQAILARQADIVYCYWSNKIYGGHLAFLRS